MNGFINQTSVPVVAPFLTQKLFPSVQSLAESCDCFKDWVWFGSEQWRSQGIEVAWAQEVHAAKGSTLRCLVLISPCEARKQYFTFTFQLLEWAFMASLWLAANAGNMQNCLFLC